MRNIASPRLRTQFRDACFLLAAILLLARAGQATAAERELAPPAPVADGTNIVFNRLSIREGLSYAVVHSVLQDRHGFMWFGTVAGLDRYDGYNFKVYGADDNGPGDLHATTISALAEDQDGTDLDRQHGRRPRSLRSAE